MKKVTILAVFAAFLGFSSCGEAEAKVDETLVNETLEVQNEVDDVNEEIEEIVEAEIALEESMEELDF